MVNINSFSNFPDPFISPQSFIVNTSKEPELAPIDAIAQESALKISQNSVKGPFIAKELHEVPDESIIVYRGSPTGYCAGPNIQIPILNIDVTNGQANSQVFVSCTSTYPESTPYNPIADRYEVRLFRDGWILTLADGCGLHLSSRLAPKAAMEGFWKFLTDRLKNDQSGFKTQKLALYLYEAIQAGHLNIYWDAYLRNQEGYTAHKQSILTEMKELQKNPQNLPNSEIESQQETVSHKLNMIIDALKGDRACQRRIMEQNIETDFFQNYAGATTFFCSALVKGTSSEKAPYYLMSVSLGDCKGYLLRNNEILEITTDTREDLSNCRDPGGKIGLCTPVPLLIDSRNLQFSLTPCYPSDVLFFMTDGVVDNLDPERLGLLPQGKNSPNEIIQKIQEATNLNFEQVSEVLDLLDLEETSWNQVSLDKGNQIKAHFGKKLLEKMVLNAPDPKTANQIISDYCHTITQEHRDEKPPYFNLFGDSHFPIGKPDHTTVITMQIPKK